MSKINLYALPCPVLRAGQDEKKFLTRAQDRTGQDIAGHRAGQGRKKCPVTVSGVNKSKFEFLIVISENITLNQAKVLITVFKFS
jgi:hypothetical protein